jgi:hypothetical protein
MLALERRHPHEARFEHPGPLPGASSSQAFVPAPMPIPDGLRIGFVNHAPARAGRSFPSPQG